MTHYEAVSVAFEADRKLCGLMGIETLAARSWSNLSAHQRAAWLDRGPDKPEVRARLYSAILGALDVRPEGDPK